jgi:DHA2 family multidrug resistance protein
MIAERAGLSAHTSKFNPVFQHRVAELQNVLAHKVDAAQAMKQAQKLVYNTLLQQASLVGYVNNFRLVAVTCLLCAPLVLLFKKVSAPRGPMASH